MLAIDTCGAEGAVALARVKGERPTVLAQRTLPGRETQERLMSSVKEVLREASLTIADVQLIAIATGPGSFTGVRIGIATAKGFAEALNVPLIAVSRLRMLVHRGGGTSNAWLDAGRGDVYVGEYQDGLCLRERMLTRADADALGGHIVVGEELLRDAGEWVGAPIIDDLVHLAATDAAASKFADTALLDANYLRIPDAELALKARQP